MLAVALQAPAHGEWRKLLDPVHGLHRPVALLASDTGKHVLAVIEINKIRKVVDLHPADRALPLDRFLQFFDLDGLLFQNAMAVHADACRGDASMPAGPCCVMTI